MRATCFALLLAGSLWFSGCASSDQLLRVRSLTGTVSVANAQENSGRVLGLDSLRQAPSVQNINLLYVHGIGWTQEDSQPEFGKDLAQALAKAHGMNWTWPKGHGLCPRSQQAGQAQQAHQSHAAGGDQDTPDRVFLYRRDAQPRLLTDDRLTELDMHWLGCLDRVVLKPATGPSITLYRFFWDDALWDAMEWPHVRHDALPVPSGSQGFDDMQGLRAEGSRRLKNQVISWGLVDAAAYLGEGGKLTRLGIQGAMCAAMRSPAKLADVAQGAAAPGTAAADATCDGIGKPKDPLLVAAHSLGSRAVFDTLVTDLSAALKAPLDQLPQPQLETFFFANQIPLLGVGRLVAKDAPQLALRQQLAKPPLFVAFSEVNDLLSYELVPYFENLHYARCAAGVGQPGDGRGCTGNFQADFQRSISNLNAAERQALSQRLGFDVVDVRLQFAPVLPLLNLGRPDVAHSAYISASGPVRRILLCGFQAPDGRKPAACSLQP